MNEQLLTKDEPLTTWPEEEKGDKTPYANHTPELVADSLGNEIEDKPTPFPLDVLPPVLRNLAEQSANVFQVPVEMPAMVALGALAGAMGKSHELAGVSNGTKGYGNLYIIVAAEIGTGKGAVTKQIMAPILEENKRLIEHFKKEVLPEIISEKKINEAKSKFLLEQAKKAEGQELEDLKREIQKCERKLAIASISTDSPSYIASNATSEALASLLARSGETALVFSPEGGGVLRVMGGLYRSDGKSDYDLLLSGYSSEPFRQDRQTRGTVDIKPTISMVLMVQPSIVHEVLGNPEALERGLIARCLLVNASGPIAEDDGIEREIQEDVAQEWDELIKDCLDLRERDPIGVSCTDEAREALRKYHNETVSLRNGNLNDVQGQLSRCRENASRLALCVAVASRGISVNEVILEDAEAGIAIHRWTVDRLLRLLQASRHKRTREMATRLQELLLESGGQKRLRDLVKSNNFKEVEIEAICRTYPKLFGIEKLEANGRPSRVVKVLNR
jgi:hypothetical protein